MMQPTGTTAVSFLQAMMDEIHRHRPQPKSGPVMCAECGEEWINCTCDETGISRNLFAFHDRIGGTYKVWICEDPVFITHEYEGKSECIILLPHGISSIVIDCLSTSPLRVLSQTGERKK